MIDIDDKAVDELQKKAREATPGPYFVGADNANDTPHQGSGLAMVDTGRESDWPIARLCEWPTARYIAAASPATIDVLCEDWRKARTALIESLERNFKLNQENAKLRELVRMAKAILEAAR